MNPMRNQQQDTPEVNYAKLRVSLEQFQRPPEALSADEYRQLLQRVNRELAIAKKVLQSKEARDVVVPESVVNQAVAELASRYESAEQFEQALQANDLDRAALFQALEHELRVEATMEKVLAQKAAVSDAEVEIYYFQHLQRFELPETRTARHILITLNDDYAENSREQVLQRMNAMRTELIKDGESFAEMAQRHSECPTAMHEGLLGRIKPGQLYPELDSVLFRMEEGGLSTVLESPVGMHLLLCETIHPAERLPFEQVKEKLREHLEMKKRKCLLQDWLQQKN
jgi:peptidyl-prolyl cis-trans isomerase C